MVIPSLAGGGAERVMTIMANYWVAAGWDVTVITLDDGAKLSYDLDDRVGRVHLAVAGNSMNTFDAVRNNLRRINVLRDGIRSSRPDGVLSFLDTANVTTILATRGLRVPVIVCERSDPAQNRPGPVWSRLRRLTYPMADVVVVQSIGALNYFSPRVQSRARIIPNPVLLPQQSATASNVHLPRPTLLAMGRLVPAKGFDLLLKAFARIRNTHPEWTLAILGDGPLRTELELLIGTLGLHGSVLMLGHVRHPYDLLLQADLFVMSSRFEGFPNALCEAMACGLPVICTDCPSGPREIIRDGVDGVLVTNDDVAALARAMDGLMSNKAERLRLGDRASEVTERFSLSKVMRMWEDILDISSCQESSFYGPLQEQVD